MSKVGIVKWFSNAKGYGFIIAEGDETEIFAHFSEIQSDGYRSLKEGQRVSFDIIDGPKGKQATKITILAPEELPT